MRLDLRIDLPARGHFTTRDHIDGYLHMQHGDQVFLDRIKVRLLGVCIMAHGPRSGLFEVYRFLDLSRTPFERTRTQPGVSTVWPFSLDSIEAASLQQSERRVAPADAPMRLPASHACILDDGATKIQMTVQYWVRAEVYHHGCEAAVVVVLPVFPTDCSTPQPTVRKGLLKHKTGFRALLARWSATRKLLRWDARNPGPLAPSVKWTLCVPSEFRVGTRPSLTIRARIPNGQSEDCVLSDPFCVVRLKIRIRAVIQYRVNSAADSEKRIINNGFQSWDIPLNWQIGLTGERSFTIQVPAIVQAHVPSFRTEDVQRSYLLSSRLSVTMARRRWNVEGRTSIALTAGQGDEVERHVEDDIFDRSEHLPQYQAT